MTVNASTQAMWDAFCAASGTEGTHEAFAFGGPDFPELANELALLVRDGPKRATTGLLAEYEDEGEPLPEVGAYAVVQDGSGRAVCVVRTRDVRVMRFGDIDAAFAFEEGEGDRTLAWWRSAHLKFFAGVGRAVNNDSLMVCERFAKLWPSPADADAPV